MNTEITDYNARAGQVFYDADCSLCAQGVKRMGALFARRGFSWVPLQGPTIATNLGVSEIDLREEMKLRLEDGRIESGAAAWAILFRSVWWLWPVGALLSLPGFGWLGKKCYRAIARNRHCLNGHCRVTGKPLPCRHTAFFELP